ncbi:hypothetical protein QE152_g13634 [Popillia japonica]|uniref:Uncharacterized protein n=1 Tax=Popillia japonica TaxID=7064 RepID=A0AAW1LCY2_POPJA
MNRHVQSQPYYPDSFYNRHQNDVDPSYQQRNDSTYNNQQTNSNIMNRHVQSQPYYPDSFYNRHQNDVDPSYAHNFDDSNYYPLHDYRRGPQQHPSQEIATVSTLQSSVADTSAQILIFATTHMLQSATASELNTSGTKTSSTSGERDRNDNPRIRPELGHFLQLYHSGSAEQ